MCEKTEEPGHRVLYSDKKVSRFQTHSFPIQGLILNPLKQRALFINGFPFKFKIFTGV